MNKLVVETTLPSGQRLQIVKGDITQEAVDAIVNAANSHLQHGGGVAGIISQRGGPQIQAESNTWVRLKGPISHEEPAYTSAGKLPCRYVIHAVGPVWGEKDEDAKLTAAVQGALRLADRLELASIALPAISTGIYGFPIERAARVILLAIEKFFARNPNANPSTIHLTLYDDHAVAAFLQAWQERKYKKTGPIERDSTAA